MLPQHTLHCSWERDLHCSLTEELYYQMIWLHAIVTVSSLLEILQFSTCFYTKIIVVTALVAGHSALEDEV